jgi:steroid delta-isomerase-like uncharacterized protein
MPLEENKALLRRFAEEALNRGNLDAIDEFMPPEFVEHEPLPVPGTGREAVKQFFAQMRSGLPDLQMTIEDLIAEGDRVVARFAVQGTHQGHFLGIPPTGKRAGFTGIDIVRIAGGRIVEHWGNTDTLGFLQQLGAIPAPEQASA